MFPSETSELFRGSARVKAPRTNEEVNGPTVGSAPFLERPRPDDLKRLMEPSRALAHVLRRPPDSEQRVRRRRHWPRFNPRHHTKGAQARVNNDAPAARRNDGYGALASSRRRASERYGRGTRTRQGVTDTAVSDVTEAARTNKRWLRGLSQASVQGRK